MRQSIVVTLFLSTLCGLWAETSSAAISPEKVVAELYAAHKNERADPLLYPASKKLLGTYFEKSLLSLFLKDQSESHGEVGKLDFDPLYHAQDFILQKLLVATVSEKKDFGRSCGLLQKHRYQRKNRVLTIQNTAKVEE